MFAQAEPLFVSSVPIFGSRPFLSEDSASQGLRELDGYVRRLYAAPADQKLREDAIRFAAKLRPRPNAPAAAERLLVEAIKQEKEATGPESRKRVIDAYGEVLLLAPWWGEAYYNLGFALDAQGRYEDAVKAGFLYHLADPKEAELSYYELRRRDALAGGEGAGRSDGVWALAGKWTLLVMGDARLRTGAFLEVSSGAAGGLSVLVGGAAGKAREVKNTGGRLSFTIDISSPIYITQDFDLSLSADGESLSGWVVSRQNLFQKTMMRKAGKYSVVDAVGKRLRLLLRRPE